MTHQFPLDLAKSAADVEAEFAEQARALLENMKDRSGMTFEKIAQELAWRDLGAETAGQLKAKFRRGKFSYAFFMRVALAMNIVEARYGADMVWKYGAQGKRPTMSTRLYHVTDDDDDEESNDT